MRCVAPKFSCLRWLLGLSLLGSSVLAQADAPLALTVGGAQISLAQLQQRLNRTWPHPAVKATPAALKRHVQEALIPQLRVERYAVDQGPRGDAAYRRDRANRALSQAMERRSFRAGQVSEEAIQDFYERFSWEYQRPQAIQLWRILVDERATAQKIIDAVSRKGNGVEIWWKLAREQSLDNATKWRYGDLGFIRKGGDTDVPQVRVNPALYTAAEQVKDGQLVEMPVADGERFSVVWRRGTRPTSARSLDSERENIRAILKREQAAKEFDGLIKKLREVHLKAYKPELVESIEYPPPAAVPTSIRPLRPKAPAASPEPKAGPRGAR